MAGGISNGATHSQSAPAGGVMSHRTTRLVGFLSGVLAVLLCVGLLMFWVLNWLWLYHPGVLPYEPCLSDGWPEPEHSWMFFGAILAGVVLVGYIFPRHRPHGCTQWVWFIGGYTAIPLIAAGLCSVWLRGTAGEWPLHDQFLGNWGTVLLGYGAGCLFAYSHGLRERSIDALRAAKSNSATGRHDS